jgi:hypothetical protein
VNDPLDLLAPSVPNVNPGPAGTGGPAPRVDPFPYGGSPNSNMYDPYAHAPSSMQMPNANDYLSNPTMGGSGPYPAFGGGETGVGGGGGGGGYGAAALGMGAAGAGAGAYAAASHSHTSHDQSSQGGYNNGPSGYPSPAGNAKQREAAAERQRLRASNNVSGSGGPSGYVSGEGSGSAGGAPSPPMSDDRRQSGIYQHTDMGSAPEEEEEPGQEIPPK